jgi:hypothetical protein
VSQVSTVRCQASTQYSLKACGKAHGLAGGFVIKQAPKRSAALQQWR